MQTENNWLSTQSILFNAQGASYMQYTQEKMEVIYKLTVAEHMIKHVFKSPVNCSFKKNNSVNSSENNEKTLGEYRKVWGEVVLSLYSTMQQTT